MATIENFQQSQLFERRKDASRLQEKEQKKLITDFMDFNPFSEDWIKKCADREMIDFAEVLGCFLAPFLKNDTAALTNSQIRNVFSEIKRIQMGGFNDKKAAFLILKPKVAYAAGRQNKLGINTFKAYFNQAFAYVENERNYLNFCNLLESILAYHKAFGGKNE
jgi:CRISPR-associated protein Csm2